MKVLLVRIQLLKECENVTCKNSVIYGNLAIFCTDKLYFIRILEKCCDMVIYTKNITNIEK